MSSLIPRAWRLFGISRQLAFDLFKSGAGRSRVGAHLGTEGTEFLAQGHRLSLVEPQALSIKAESAMDPSLCQRYDALLAKHAPDDYESAPITLSAASPFSCDKLDSSALWKRYGEAIQAQTELLKSGRIDQAQAMALSQKFSTFGTQMSTDSAAACATFKEIEGELAGYAK